MPEQIRKHCALLLSEDFHTHWAAYLWLRESAPFRRVLEKFREYDLNLFDVAAMLADGSSRPMAEAAVTMLLEEISQEKNGLRDTTPL